MFFVSFIVALFCTVIAVCLFGRGLVRLYRDRSRSMGLISSGFGFALLGVVLTAILVGFFNL